MNLFLHVDRAGKLSPNKIIELEPCLNESRILAYASLFVDGFTEHLNKLCEKGLSEHGIQYLIRFFDSGLYTPLLFKELYLELIRWKYNISEVSRFQAFFAWGRHEDALSFAKLVSKGETKGCIYEVEPLGGVFKADMNLARGDMNIENALAYWNGKRFDNNSNYVPVWEYLLEVPVRVIREVKDADSYKTLSCLIILMIVVLTIGCELSVGGSIQDRKRTIEMGNNLQAKLPTPTDIDYSLERYNLIRHAYWVNGQRERARMYPSPIADVPFGYVVLFTNSGAIVGRFIVEGKVSSLNSYLTPDSEYYEVPSGAQTNEWLADVDGTYGTNDNGIIFFTPDGKYIEWNGTYIYSDIPFEVVTPVLRIGE